MAPTLPDQAYGNVLRVSKNSPLMSDNRRVHWSLRPVFMEVDMVSKTMNYVIMTGILLAFSAPVAALAEDAAPPKTKAECKKMTDMKWDKTTKTCVKK
jgi:hypothetical protein